jgi:hypothetical protein
MAMAGLKLHGISWELTGEGKEKGKERRGRGRPRGGAARGGAHGGGGGLQGEAPWGRCPVATLLAV